MEIKFKEYSAPEITKIRIDKDISLQLESAPPNGPEESGLFKVDFGYQNNPFNPRTVYKCAENVII